MNLFGKWKDKATEYVDVRIQLAKLKFIERASHVIGNLVLGFVMIATMIAVLFFMGIGIMETLAAWLETRIGAAFATSGLFVLLIAVIYGMRKKILVAVADIFIRVMTDDDDDDDDDNGRKDQQESLHEEL